MELDNRMMEDIFLRVNGLKQRVNDLDDQVQAFRKNKGLYNPLQE
jgi:hypothetical protein